VSDLDVFELVGMARASGMRTGVVLDWRPESDGLTREVRRLARKVEAGAQFVVTQPVYDEVSADELAEALQPVAIPVIMGVLPLRTPRHAEFLHRKVAGIVVPERIRKRMHDAADPVAEGAANAAEMITVARQRFSGVCIMPPFDHYEVLFDILDNDR
jgi:homocysteine S-methyltransferase